MIFGRIEYLNLLPFHVFMKRFNRSLHKNMMTRYKKDIPTIINSRFETKRVDAAFISSIKAKKYKKSKLGIIAKKEVLSVLVIPNSSNKEDAASASSNALAKILKIDGEVIIGDRALKYYLTHKNYIDLAQEWHKKYNLPFVFAILCYHNKGMKIKKIEEKFLKADIKIPRYILKNASQKTTISETDVLNYLTKISYHIDTKALRGFKKFLNML